MHGSNVGHRPQDGEKPIIEIEVGWLMADRLPIDLAEATRDCLRDLHPLAQRAQVELVQLVPIDMPMLLIQRGALRCVLDVLVLNGIETTPAGGKVTVTAGGRPPRLWIGVIDGGDGIANDEVAYLMRPAERSHGSPLAAPATRRFEVARAVIELHGGAFEIHSLKGRGTTVMCCFSARDPAVDRPVEPAAAPSPGVRSPD